MGLMPCPVCHVPKNELHDFGKTWPLRNGLETQKIIAESKSLGATAGERLLSSKGLRAIDVCQSFDKALQIFHPLLECIYECCMVRPS